ncbi:MAG: hypothetical protein V4498_01950 [candidate division FCPU426 bacterium]
MKLCLKSFLVVAAMAISSMAGAVSALSVTRTSSPTFYIEASAPTSLCSYASYSVYNNSGSDLPDVWATLSNFSNANLHVSTNESNLTHVGAIPSHVTKTAFFYLCGDAQVVGAITHDFNAYASSVTSGASINTTSFSYTGITDGNQTGSTPIIALNAIPNPPILGGSITVKVSCSAGNLSAGGFISFSPASFASWPCNAFQLESTVVTLSNKNVGTYTNQLYISGLSNGNSTDYYAEYTFRVVSTTAAPTSGSPISFQDSGSVKETSPDTTGFQPVSVPTNTLLLALDVIPSTVIYPNWVAVTVTVTNTGANSVNLDGFRFTLPSSPGTPVIEAGTSKFAGVATVDPSDLGGGLWGWDGVYTVPANSSVALTFYLSLPNTLGSYPLTATAKVGSLVIDRTTGTSDYVPGTATVTVALPTPTFSVSPTISETYTISPTYSATAVSTQSNTPTQVSSPTVTETSTPTETPIPTFSHSPTLTRTETSTPLNSATPTFSHSPTLTRTETSTPVNSATPTFSRTPTLTRTETDTPGASPTPTDSRTPTLTRTETSTPTPSSSPTPSRTPTGVQSATSTHTETPVVIATSTAVIPSELIFKLGKNPAKRGSPICMYANAPIAYAEWTVFGSDQQLVARLTFTEAKPCFTETQDLAPGVYIARIKARDIYGHTSDVVRLFLIQP